MMCSTRLFLSLTLVLGLAACGSSAVSPPSAPQATGPTTWKLIAGGSSQNEALQNLQFYPASLTIDVGDTVTWSFPAGEPHTVTFLGPQSSPPPPNDPSAPAPAGGSTYDGSVYTSSGFVLLGKTYSLTFTKPGTYKYYCLLHSNPSGGMEGTITVNAAGTPYPQLQAGYTAAGSSASAADQQQAQNTLAQFPYALGGPHLVAGMSYNLLSGTGVNSTVLRFLDGTSLGDTNVTVPVGSTVTWTNNSTNEPHTVTFGVAGQPFPSLNPFSPPSGPTSYDGSTLVNSGVLPPGQSFSLTFTKAGTFTYHCIFHDDTENMIGTVTVQ